jgi:protein TonB
MHLEVSLLSTMAQEGFSSPVPPPTNPGRKEEEKVLPFSLARVDPKDRSVHNSPEVIEEKKEGIEEKKKVAEKQEEGRDREGEKPGSEPMLQRVSVSSNSDTTMAYESQDLTLRNPSSMDGFQRSAKLSSPPGGEIIFIQPSYGENPKPPYPPEARRKGYHGEVLLKVQVLSNGQVGEIEVKKSSGYDVLDRSALNTVRKWKFVPARKGETPVSLWVNIPIRFQLQ